ncbi:MAG: hypothetical protein M0Q91_12915 [Methanoregula sp.]|jgi:hypothetical protein|nr:hypothetical protein [Methanoregula sp.]
MEVHQQERRILNDAIEQAYLDVCDLASSIDLYFHTGDGVLLLLYKNFYYKLNFLFRLTSNQEEMIQNATKEVEEIGKWLDHPQCTQRETQMETVLKEGLLVFKKYDLALNQRGLIVLPSRRK